MWMYEALFFISTITSFFPLPCLVGTKDFSLSRLYMSYVARRWTGNSKQQTPKYSIRIGIILELVQIPFILDTWCKSALQISH